MAQPSKEAKELPTNILADVNFRIVLNALTVNTLELRVHHTLAAYIAI